MNGAPWVSVVILSWNRIDDLRHTLQVLHEDPYPRLEVIVVDNASSDGTQNMVREEFPKVRLVELDRNIGIAGWNAGFEIARGTYVLVLDDDSYPEADAIARGAAYMEEHPGCGVAGFSIFNLSRQRYETDVFTPGPELMFTGCGAMIRKSVFDKAGMFDENIFLYEHEAEFSLRVWNAGYRVDFFPDAKIVHRATQKNRGIRKGKDCRRVYFTARNIMYMFLLHYSLRNILFRAVRVFIGRLIGGLKAGCGVSALKGLLSGVLSGMRSRTSRSIVDNEVQQWFGYGSYAGGFFFEDSAYRLKRPQFLNSTFLRFPLRRAPQQNDQMN